MRVDRILYHGSFPLSISWSASRISTPAATASESCYSPRWEELGTPYARSRREARMHSGASSFVHLCRESVFQVWTESQLISSGAAEHKIWTEDNPDGLLGQFFPPQLSPIKRGKMLIRAETGAAPSPFQRKHGSLLKLWAPCREVAAVLLLSWPAAVSPPWPLLQSAARCFCAPSCGSAPCSADRCPTVRRCARLSTPCTRARSWSRKPQCQVKPSRLKPLFLQAWGHKHGNYA